jgi:hypothetical protein
MSDPVVEGLAYLILACSAYVAVTAVARLATAAKGWLR